MKSLVLFDSNFGNTKKIAETIAQRIGQDAKAISVTDFSQNDLQGIVLLVVGSPINGWRPSERMGIFLASLTSSQLKGVNAASFDTRINVFFHGDAAKKIAAMLQKAGATIVANPEFFYVKGKEGPLADGEIEKATKWADTLTNNR